MEGTTLKKKQAGSIHIFDLALLLWNSALTHVDLLTRQAGISISDKKGDTSKRRTRWVGMDKALGASLPEAVHHLSVPSLMGHNHFALDQT